MKTNIDQLAKELEAWEVRTGKQQSDLMALFESDRSLFLKLSTASLSSQAAKQHPPLAALAKLARSSMQFAGRLESSDKVTGGAGKVLKTFPKAHLQEMSRFRGNRIKKRQKRSTAANLTISPAMSFTGEEKLIRFTGTPISKGKLFSQAPELTNHYQQVIQELKKHGATTAELAKSTEIPKKKLAPILERLQAKKLIRTRKHKQKLVFYFAPHR